MLDSFGHCDLCLLRAVGLRFLQSAWLISEWWIDDFEFSSGFVSWNYFPQLQPSQLSMRFQLNLDAKVPVIDVTATYVKTGTVVITQKSGFPLGPENLEKWEGIFQSGILNRLEKSGKITWNTGKLR